VQSTIKRNINLCQLDRQDIVLPREKRGLEMSSAWREIRRREKIDIEVETGGYTTMNHWSSIWLQIRSTLLTTQAPPNIRLSKTMPEQRMFICTSTPITSSITITP